MALLNFPDPLSIQTYTANGNSWEWNGTSWISANNLNLSDQVTGVLGTVYGGTGKALSGMSVGSVIYADTSSSFAALAPGNSNYVLATQGSGSAPYWKIDDSGTGSVGNGITGGFAYYSGLNTIKSGSAVSYIEGSNRIVLTSQILSLPSSVIDSGIWAGTAISLANGGTNGNRAGIAISYELAVYNAAGTAITQIDTTSAIGNSVLLQANQASFPTWVGQSSLVVGGATTAGTATTSITAGLAVSSTNAGLAVSSTNAGLAVSSTSAGLAISATGAGLAVSATNAGLAVSSTSAGLAISATGAGLAVSATNAGLAVSSTNAGLAVSSGTAGSSISAGLAISSTNAGLAVSSTSAGLAISATGAGLAVSSTNAGLAVSSTNAGLAVSSGTAGSSISAGLAISSTNAGLAVSSTNAGLAVSSTNAGLAVSSTNAGLAVSSGTAGSSISAGLAISSTNAGLAVSASRSETIRTQNLSGVNYLVLSSSDSATTSQSLFVGSGISATSSLLVVPEDTILGARTPSTTTTSGALVVYGGTGITGNLNVGGNLVLAGDLTVNGTTTTVNSTVSTIVDPIITIGTGIGGTVPNTADSKDRGVAFYYFSGTGRTGFFGWDQSASKFTLLSAATITAGEEVSGTKGVLIADLDGNAGTATSSTTAGLAISSTNAGLAVSSTNAGLAVSSTSAGLAISATNAGLAVSSTNAGLAVSSGTAGSSISAGLAISSTSAGLAISATGAGLAVSATNAGLAVSSGTAGSSISAGLAISSTNAGLAVSSTSAGLAISATGAGLAVSSTNAGLAVSSGTAGSSISAGLAISSTNAGLAVSSTSAGLAISATGAGLAVSSTNAGLAVSSTNAGLATSSVLVGIGTTIATAYLAAVLLNTATGGTQIYTGSGITIGNNRITATTFQGNYLGTWTGTAVTALYGGTGLASVNKLDVLTGASSGNSWIAIGSTFLPSAYIGENAPAALAAFGATQPGQLWWDSTYGVLKVYYADINTNQWVDALPVLGSNGGSAVKRSYLLSFGAGFTPSLGSDSVSILIPFAPDNSVSYYYIKRLELRNEGTISGAGASFFIERNTTRTPTSSWTTANTIFSAAGSSFKAGAGIYITSYTNSGSGASFVSSAGVAASIMSGDYLRLNFTALNGAATLAVSLMIEEQ